MKDEHRANSENKSARKKFHEQNQFHKEKRKITTTSVKNYQHAMNSINQISVTRRKIDLEVSRREKSICNNQRARSSTNKKHVTSSINKISFTRGKINIQVFRREKSTCNKFREQKSVLQGQKN